jgi:hypothetical protein
MMVVLLLFALFLAVFYVVLMCFLSFFVSLSVVLHKNQNNWAGADVQSVTLAQKLGVPPNEDEE